MSTLRYWLPLFMLVITLVLPQQSALARPDAPALAAAVNCSCVVYVQNRYNLAKPWVNSAKDMGPVLKRNGFRQVTTPQIGAVVVMQPKFPGANGTHGHVGVIEKLSSPTPTQWKLKLRQGSSATSGATEYGCKNIQSIEWAAYPKTNTLITYWVK